MLYKVLAPSRAQTSPQYKYEVPVQIRFPLEVLTHLIDPVDLALFRALPRRLTDSACHASSAPCRASVLASSLPCLLLVLPLSQPLSLSVFCNGLDDAVSNVHFSQRLSTRSPNIHFSRKLNNDCLQL